MAYTPINWQTGDTITADKLNRCDNGWAVEITQLFSETVTTADQDGMNSANLAYNGTINADTIAVTFDNTEYECPRIDVFGGYFYGGFTEQGPVFTEYPFAILSLNGNMVFTETAGEHTIAVTAPTLQTSADFISAVAVASSPELLVATENATTWQKVHDAVSAGKFAFAYVLDEDSGDVFCYPVVAVTHGRTYQVATLQKSGSDVTLRYYIADTADGPIYPN